MATRLMELAKSIAKTRWFDAYVTRIASVERVY